MRALVYEGPYRVRVREKPAPRVEHPDDVVLRVTRAAICGSDLHLFHGLVPDTRVGTTFGHEFTGVVESSNPANQLASGVYGYSHTTGGYDGGQAQYVRVPFADVGPMKIPEDMEEDDVLLLSDVLPTGYQAAEMGSVKEGDTVAVFGCGPVGLAAARSAWLFGAGRVIAIDRVEARLRRLPDPRALDGALGAAARRGSRRRPRAPPGPRRLARPCGARLRRRVCGDIPHHRPHVADRPIPQRDPRVRAAVRGRWCASDAPRDPGQATLA